LDFNFTVQILFKKRISVGKETDRSSLLATTYLLSTKLRNSVVIYAASIGPIVWTHVQSWLIIAPQNWDTHDTKNQCETHQISGTKSTKCLVKLLFYNPIISLHSE